MSIACCGSVGSGFDLLVSRSPANILLPYFLAPNDTPLNSSNGETDYRRKENMLKMKLATVNCLSLASIMMLYRQVAGFVVRFPQSSFLTPVVHEVQHCTYSHSAVLLGAKPKRGSVVDSFRTVSVNCSKCTQRLFRYKKKNGTKSNLIKCYVERIVEDSAGVLAAQESSGQRRENYSWACPSCGTQFARTAQIHGRPALKIIGGKIRMTKK